jgi:hypothetical protein
MKTSAWFSSRLRIAILQESMGRVHERDQAAKGCGSSCRGRADSGELPLSQA